LFQESSLIPILARFVSDLLDGAPLIFSLIAIIALLGVGATAAAEGEGANPTVEVDSTLSVEEWRLEAGVAFAAGVPQGDFRGDTSYGFSVFGGVGLPNLPIVLLGDLTVLIRGQESENLAKTSSRTIDVSVDSDIAMFHAVFRLQPATGRFRPFLDALVGFKGFETRTSVRETLRDCIPDEFFDCDLGGSNKKNNSDIAFSYGLGAGADLRLYQGERVQARLFVAARYLFGEKADYVVPSSVKIDGNTVRFQKARTRTDLIATQLGFSIVF